jgi:hypothetical protein
VVRQLRKQHTLAVPWLPRGMHGRYGALLETDHWSGSFASMKSTEGRPRKLILESNDRLDFGNRVLPWPWPKSCHVCQASRACRAARRATHTGLELRPASFHTLPEVTRTAVTRKAAGHRLPAPRPPGTTTASTGTHFRVMAIGPRGDHPPRHPQVTYHQHNFRPSKSLILPSSPVDAHDPAESHRISFHHRRPIRAYSPWKLVASGHPAQAIQGRASNWPRQ